MRLSDWEWHCRSGGWAVRNHEDDIYLLSFLIRTKSGVDDGDSFEGLRSAYASARLNFLSVEFTDAKR